MGNMKVFFSFRRRIKDWELSFVLNICPCQTDFISVCTETVDSHDHLYSIFYFIKNFDSRDLMGTHSSQRQTFRF